MDNETKQKIIQRQKQLSDIVAVSGHEAPMAQLLMEQLRPLCSRLWQDRLGSVFCLLEATEMDAQETLLLDAHMDEVGIMVQHIEQSGFLRFVPLGGWDERIFPGLAVKLLNDQGKEFYGVIGTTPPHLQKQKEKKESQFDELYIDLGFDSRSEVTHHGIHIGSIGTPYSPFRELGKNKLQGKAFDDRTGVNILWELIEHFSKGKRKAHLAFSFSVQEEVGLRGAGPAFFATNPTLAIAVENTTAGDTPGIAERNNPTVLGKGPAITLADKGLLASQWINERLVETALRHDIPYQWKRPLFGGTNAGRIHTSGHGVATSVVSVPARYIHSPTTIINHEDLFFSIKLLQKFIDSV